MCFLIDRKGVLCALVLGVSDIFKTLSPMGV